MFSRLNAYNTPTHIAPPPPPPPPNTHTHRGNVYQKNGTEEKVFENRRFFKEDLKELTGRMTDRNRELVPDSWLEFLLYPERQRRSLSSSSGTGFFLALIRLPRSSSVSPVVLLLGLISTSLIPLVLSCLRSRSCSGVLRTQKLRFPTVENPELTL